MNRKVLLYLVLIAAAAGAPYVLGPKPGTQAEAPSVVSTAHAQAAASTATAQPKVASPLPNLGTAPVGRIESDQLRISVTSVNGGFLSAQLKSPRFARDGVPIDLV